VGYDTSSGGPYTYTPLDPTYVTDHTVGLAGLTPSTPYYYVVRSTDADETTPSSEYTFTTLAAPPPPTTPMGVVVASARIGQEPVIAYATNVTDTTCIIHLIKQDGTPIVPADGANVQWILATYAETDDAGKFANSSGQAIQIPEYAEHNNAAWAYFPILFDGTPVGVNNAHASDNEPYIAAPWSIGPLRFKPLFSDHSGIHEPTAWLHTISVGSVESSAVPLFKNDYVIQVGRDTYSDDDFIHFPVAYDEAPVVIANAWDPVGLQPMIASVWGNATTGFFISLRYHDGTTPVAPVSVWVQWIAVGIWESP